MSYIRSYKHGTQRAPLMSSSLIALAAFGTPFAAQAQSTERKEARLPDIVVKAEADANYKADTVSSPKLTAPLLDTTQTITVIKKEVLQEQGAGSLMEALRNTPGITLQLGENGNTSAGDTFQLRGFAAQSSIFLDGIRDLGAVTRDIFNVEQIEISRGPAGTDVGRGAAGGYINLASKLPHLDNAMSATVSYDSGERVRGTTDLNQRIGATSAFRLNLLAQDGGVMGRKVIERKAAGVAPALAFGLGTPTRVFVFSQHLRLNGLPDGGLPAVGLEGYVRLDNTPLAGAPAVSRNNFYGADSDYEKVDSDMATVKVEHQLGKAMLTNTSRYGKSSMDRILTGVNTITLPLATMNDRNTWTLSRSRQSVFQENKILANTTNIVTDFSTGSIGHTLSAGLELLSEEQFSPTRINVGVMAAANLYNPNSADPVTGYNPTRNGVFTQGRTRTAALYAFDTIKLNEQWQINGGVRFERYNTETRGAALSTSATPAIPVGTLVASEVEKSDRLVSWKAGALYKPTADGSVYLAYATSQTPPGSANFGLSATTGNINNASMAPQKTTNVELGTKWDLIQKKLAVTGTVYRTENKNEFPVQDPVTLRYEQAGNRRVEGGELGVVGQITPAWSIIAGVAKMEATLIEGSGSNIAGTATRWSPDLSANVWTTYMLNDKLSIGGGVRYMGMQRKVVAPGFPLANGAQGIPSYAVADAVLSYRVNPSLAVQLNVYNLTDKFYINALNSGGSRVTVGVERSAQLTANVAF